MKDPFLLSEENKKTRPWLESLNPEQREAVETTEGPLLVLSGAGTGKTRVLTSRLGFIIENSLAQPWEVLAVTFTNRAAKEMRERVLNITGPISDSIWLGTFHSVAAKILRKHAKSAGLENNFIILDSDDQLRLLKQIIEENNFEYNNISPQVLMSWIQFCKDKGLNPEQVSFDMMGDLAICNVIELYKKYQYRLAELNCVDFGDLLLHCLNIFRADNEILSMYQKKFKYILVDEYQDTNVCQYLWLRLISQQHKNLCCVGDDGQSIYSWRGAEVENILRFEKDFENSKTIRLERNYRSTSKILNAASNLISFNKDRLGKTLIAAKENDGDKLTVRGVWDGTQEAIWLASEVNKLNSKGQSLSSIAILVRAGFQTLEFEEKFINAGISYRVFGGPRFYERLEIKDLIAYLRCICPETDDLAFQRIINKPKRGIGQSTLQKIRSNARTFEVSMMQSAKDLLETDDLRVQTKKNIALLLKFFSEWRKASEFFRPTDLVNKLVEDIGYIEDLQKENSTESQGRVENIREFIRSLDDWDSINSFLDHVSLVMENETDTTNNFVTIMTLHAAKGSEFDIVFLPGWEEDVFPHRRSLDDARAGALEEERRLAYVGLTRAKKKIFISYAANRRIYNQWQTSLPSRFINELPSDVVENISDTGFLKSHSSYTGSKLKPNTIIESSKVNNQSSLTIGMRIFHQKFGYGKIKSIDSNKLSIDFEKAGNKKVLSSFVQLPP